MTGDPQTPRPAKPLPDENDVRRPGIGPHPIDRPDERKEGGPDFGKADRQREKRGRDAADAANEQIPGRDTPRS